MSEAELRCLLAGDATSVAPWIETAQEVDLRVDAYPDKTFTGKISRISPAVSAATRAFAFEALVPNRDATLKPGTFARVTVRTNKNDRVLTLPYAALQYRYGVNRVFVVDNGRLVGVLPWSRVLTSREEDCEAADLAVPVDAAVHGDDTLREAANLMVATGHGVLPVVSPDGALLGLITQFDLLRAHERTLVEERHRESPLRPRWSWRYGATTDLDAPEVVPESAAV